MPVHTVQQGQTLASIAQSYGFTDADVIWNHAENQELKKAGRTPATLAPGDSVFVPDLKVRELTKGTETRHTVTVKHRPLRLQLALQRLTGEPVASASGKLQVGEKTIPVSTDAHGLMDVVLDDGTQAAELQLDGGDSTLVGVRIPLLIGHLDPVTLVSGQEARLDNLGYHAGTGGDDSALQFRSAVEEFQCDESLVVDGICGPKTQARLGKVHGC